MGKREGDKMEFCHMGRTWAATWLRWKAHCWYLYSLCFQHSFNTKSPCFHHGTDMQEYYWRGYQVKKKMVLSSWWTQPHLYWMKALFYPLGWNSLYSTQPALLYVVRKKIKRKWDEEYERKKERGNPILLLFFLS